MKKSISTTLGIIVGFVFAHIISSMIGGVGFDQMFNGFQLKRLGIIAMVVFLIVYFYNQYKAKKSSGSPS